MFYTVNVGVVLSVAGLFQGERPVPAERAARLPELLDAWFIFSVVWTVGATCDNDGRKKFDAWIRETSKTAQVRRFLGDPRTLRPVVACVSVHCLCEFRECQCTLRGIKPCVLH